MKKSTVHYRHMTPSAQREYDETDLMILKMRDAGASYRDIRDTIGVNDPRISKVTKHDVKDWLE